MQHVSVWLVREDAPAASLALAESGVFNPDSAERLRLELPDVSEARYRDAWQSARSRLDKIVAFCGRRPEPQLGEALEPVPLEELERLDARLREIWQFCFDAQERLNRASEERTRIAQLLQTLDNFSSLDIDLGALLAEHRFLDVRVGTVPSANLPRLREALGLTGFIITPFAHSAGLEHCVVAGPRGKLAELTSLLNTAGWHSVEIPQELRDHPEAARARLLEQAAALEKQAAQQNAALDEGRRSYRDELQEAENTLALAAPYAALVENALRAQGGLVCMTGWVPRHEVENLRRVLARHLRQPFLIKLRDPEPGERSQVPTLVRQRALLRSFAQLVRTYGVPRYGEVDPTWLFAVSFVLMFGMMFGDLGQGAVLAAAGLLLKGRLAPARVLAVACGVSSMVFGVVYGSVFGFEHLFHAVWMSPLQDPMRVLVLAVFWGVGFILVASLIRARNLWVESGWRAALADPGGAAGIALYAGMVWGLTRLATGHGFGTAPALLAAGGGLTVLWHAWHAQHAPAAERALVSLIETLETVIGYFANTLSFMRVGAFSLNHVALALAVFTIAEMVGGAGHWVVVVLGNVFIMVLEGAIVAIQALRLEYYEGFSRFFSGDGRAFRPLLLGGRRSES